MRKRMIVWLVLAVLFLAAVPAACAAQSGQVEDFTVEKTDSGYTVTLPAGYADSGFYKLFWKDTVSGSIQGDVFPADTTEYQIAAEKDTEYSFQLFYAKKRGLLPASWKEDQPAEALEPSVWKVLWADAETIDCLGITNRMSGEDHRISERVSEKFESYVEELTDGLVDIEITRMTIEEPITTLSYFPQGGYLVGKSDIPDFNHYAMRKYDSVFVWGRMEQVYLYYSGVTPAAPTRQEPGYAFICMVDGIMPEDEDTLNSVCVHEWLHQLGNFYSKFGLEIPNPDLPEKYGHDPAPGGTLDPRFFKEALTMKMHNPEGKFIGVPAEAWSCRPTDYTGKWNLAHLQSETDPSWHPEEIPPVNIIDPELLGTLARSRYWNPVMNLGCVLDGWYYYSQEDIAKLLALSAAAGSGSEEEEDPMGNKDWQIVMYAGANNEPSYASLYINPTAGQYMKEHGEDAYLREKGKLLGQSAAENSQEDFSCEIIQRRIGSRTVSGLKSQFVNKLGIHVYNEAFYWLSGDDAHYIGISTYMSDNCESVLDRFYFPEN